MIKWLAQFLILGNCSMLIFINISGEADTPNAAIAEPIEVLIEAVSNEGERVGGGSFAEVTPEKSCDR